MLRIIGVAVAIAAAASVAGAQGVSASAKSTAKVPTPKATVSATTHHSVKAQSQASLAKEAKISEKTARATALKEVPNGKVRSHELERENGKLIYSYDISQSGKSGVEEVNIDAIDGSVIAHEHESAKVEAKEAKAETKSVAKVSKTKK
jgi:uncharacterized membrane protein YkoI